MAQNGKSRILWVTGEIIEIKEYVPGKGWVLLDFTEAPAALDGVQISCIDLNQGNVLNNGPLWECKISGKHPIFIGDETWPRAENEYLQKLTDEVERLTGSTAVTILVV